MNAANEIFGTINTDVDQSLKPIDHPSLADKKYRLRLMRAAGQIIDERQDAHCNDSEICLFRALHACGHELKATRNRRRRSTACRSRVIRLQRLIADYLVRSHLGLVYDMRPKWNFSEVDEDEYISAGFWCLYQSIMAFDPWRGYRFSTYACNAILRGYGHIWKQKRARHRRLHRYVDLKFKQLSNGSYVAEEGHDDDTVLRKRLSSALQSSAVPLTPAERFVIEQRFLRDSAERSPTLATVGKIIQLSKERVRQIQIAALAKLRTALEDDPVICAALESN